MDTKYHILEYIDIEGTRLSSKISATRTDFDLVAQLVEHWTSIPMVAGSIPTVVRQLFSLPGVDVYSE